MMSHYSTDQQVAVTCQDILQYASKGREEEECKIVHLDVNNTEFKLYEGLKVAKNNGSLISKAKFKPNMQLNYDFYACPEST